MLLSINRHKVPEIAELFRTTQVTVRFWIRRFNEAGPPGLYDKPRSGRPRKVGEEIQRTLKELVDSDPQHEGYRATFWTVAMLLAVLTRPTESAVEPEHLAEHPAPAGDALGTPPLGHAPQDGSG